jgi:hypothetical protein
MGGWSLKTSQQTQTHGSAHDRSMVTQIVDKPPSIQQHSSTAAHRTEMLPFRPPCHDSGPTFSSLERTFTRSAPPSFMSSARAPYDSRSQKYTPRPLIAGRKSEGQAYRPTAILPTPCPLLDTPDDLRSPPSRASDPTDPGIVALPTTPHPSLDSSGTVRPLSFDQVLSKLKPFLDGTTGKQEISIEGVSSNVFDELMKKSRASELPGWENLRYVQFL